MGSRQPDSRTQADCSKEGVLGSGESKGNASAGLWGRVRDGGVAGSE